MFDDIDFTDLNEAIDSIFGDLSEEDLLDLIKHLEDDSEDIILQTEEDL